MNRIDTIIMGRKSYEQILTFGEWAWSDKQTYVFTSKPLTSDNPSIVITYDSPTQFVSRFKERKSGKDIWLLGGAQLVKSFASEVDEIILTIVPHILKEGIPLGLNLENFRLMREKQLSDGMVQNLYLGHPTAS